MLDAPDRSRPVHKKNLWTVRFLITSLSSVVLVLVVLEFRSTFYLSRSDKILFLFVLHVIAVTSALAGLIMGFTERSYNKKLALIGIIGNSVILAIYLVLAIAAVYFISRLNY